MKAATPWLRVGGAGGMAYRFLLEVPERLADDASLVIDQAGDAQVLVARPSHGLGVDAPYLDLTTAAHSLRVIELLGGWYNGLPEPRANVGIVLHGGERYSLGEMSPNRIVALIRHDQPWVERSIPHVGDHEPKVAPSGFSTGAGAPAVEVVGVEQGTGGMELVEEFVPAGEEASAHGLQAQAINYVLVQVNDLRKAERFYERFFAMQLMGRLRRGADGTLTPLPVDYSWDQAMQTGDLAEITFFSSGPVTLAVQDVGMGVLLGKGPVDLVSVGVDARTFTRLKSEVLMYPLTILRSGVASFVFRDPLGVNWEIAVTGSVPLIPA
jgi:catechol 2,3-dioxygenase-like lactoylglutathione lyase family enzyme